MDIKDLGHKVEIREPDVFMSISYETERVYIDYKGFVASYGLNHPMFSGCETPTEVYKAVQAHVETK